MEILRRISEGWKRVPLLKKLEVCLLVLIYTSPNQLNTFRRIANAYVISNHDGHIINCSFLTKKGRNNPDLKLFFKKAKNINDIISLSDKTSYSASVRTSQWQTEKLCLNVGEKKYRSIIRYRMLEKDQIGLDVIFY